MTGDEIPIASRIGLLDRKLRVVNENTGTEQEWKTWALRAFQSVYGYEFQGDNLVLARENLLLTYIEYYMQIVIVTGQQGHNSRPEKDIISGQMLS